MTNTIITLIKTQPIVVGEYLALDAKNVVHFVDIQIDKVTGELEVIYNRGTKANEPIANDPKRLVKEGNTFYKIEREAVDGGIQLTPVQGDEAGEGFYFELTKENKLWYVDAWKREGRQDLSYHMYGYDKRTTPLDCTLEKSIGWGEQFYKIPKLTH